MDHNNSGLFNQGHPIGTQTLTYQCTTHFSAVAVSGPAFASCPFQPPPALVFTGDHDPNDVATRSSLALLGGDVITTVTK